MTTFFKGWISVQACMMYFIRQTLLEKISLYYRASTDTHSVHEDIISSQELITSEFIGEPYAFKKISCAQNLDTECAANQNVVDFKTEDFMPKNYHYMGAALVSCELTARGVAQDSAIRLETSSALSYRTITTGSAMKMKFEALESDIKSLEKLLSSWQVQSTLNIVEFDPQTQTGDRLQDKILKWQHIIIKIA